MIACHRIHGRGFNLSFLNSGIYHLSSHNRNTLRLPLVCPSQIPPFTQTAFYDPFFIAYSSRKTEISKCIVHSVSGSPPQNKVFYTASGSSFQSGLTIGEQNITKLEVSPRWMLDLIKDRILPREVIDLRNSMVLSGQLLSGFMMWGF